MVGAQIFFGSNGMIVLDSTILSKIDNTPFHARSLSIRSWSLRQWIDRRNFVTIFEYS